MPQNHPGHYSHLPRSSSNCSPQINPFLRHPNQLERITPISLGLDYKGYSRMIRQPIPVQLLHNLHPVPEGKLDMTAYCPIY